MDLGAVEVDQPADLAEVVLGIGLDLFLGELGAGLVAARGVADEGGVVADDDHGRVTEVLELPEFPERHGMAEVNVDPGRVDAVLDPQGHRSRTERSSLARNSASGTMASTPRRRISSCWATSRIGVLLSASRNRRAGQSAPDRGASPCRQGGRGVIPGPLPIPFERGRF